MTVTDAGADPVGLIESLAGFGSALRAAGLPVGTGDVMAYCAAVAALEPGDLLDVYWAGRVSLVTKREQLPDYDETFRAYFLDEPSSLPEPLRRSVREAVDSGSTLAIPETEPGTGRPEDQATLGLEASAVTALKKKSFTACSPDELAALRRIMARMRLQPPRRRTRRTVRARNGRTPDLRRIVREAMRHHGEPTELFWRRRRLRVRPLVLVLDVSGSMADYSRALLQFAHTAGRSASRVEVFCFGTRLSRITLALRRRKPDEALRVAAETVNDWDGGTHIGDSLRTLVREHGRRGMCRGAVVVVCSDALDRGDPEVLEQAVESLARLCHRLIWLSPLVDEDRSAVPSTMAMSVVQPYVDTVLPVRDLRSLERLALHLSTTG